MIITLRESTSPQQKDEIITFLKKYGVSVSVIEGTMVSVIGLVGDTFSIDIKAIQAFHYVKDVQRIAEPYKKVNRMFHPIDTIIDVAGIKIGGQNPIVVMAGPCSVENEELLLETASNIKSSGAKMLRGGAYKPRTSPYSFQGLGIEGLKLLKKAKKETGLPIVSEIMDANLLPEFEEYVDLLQVGARNMQNYELLKALGKSTKPVLLKRGFSNTIEEWLMSAEYIVTSGNPNVILCERGIRTFETATRNTLDLSVVQIVKRKTHLPIVIDPSHATGDWRLVESMSLAAIAAGTDGLIIEVHNQPEKAFSDGAQSLTYQNFAKLVEKGRKIAEVVGRKF